MSLCLTPLVAAITASVTGRRAGLFDGDLAALAPRLQASLAGRRVLLAGAAGSIGSATLLRLLPFAPAAVAVLDPAENNLAELVRTVRSSGSAFAGSFQVEPLAYGSHLAAAWLERQPAFDLVLSFAALKHVRSERDAFSTLRLLEVNLLEADRFLAACRRHGHGRAGVFFVSTDKAADPVNLMGASKRLMEHLLWAHGQAGSPASLLDGGSAPPLLRATTTRFANVAFSDGSLPWGFLQRLAKGQPLAAPTGIRRYLVSPDEAGGLCLLAALIAPHRHALVPHLDPARDTVDFPSIAEATLRHHGLVPAWYDDEEAARRAVDSERAAGRWPVLRTVPDTAGEKELEVFAGAGESLAPCGMAACRAVPGGEPDLAALSALLRWIADSCAGRTPPPDKAEVVARLAAALPAFAHRETGLSLDGRM